MRKVSRGLIGFLLLFLLATGARAEDKYFDSKSVKIHYIVEGKGEPVVLIHGFTADINSHWSKLIKPLSETHQVIALDCRGHGKSDKPTDPKMYGREMGEDVVRLMDHLHIKKAHLVGWSMGAYIAYGLLFIHPDRILTLTLGSGGGIPEPGTLEAVKAVAESLEKDKSFEPLIRALWPPDLPAPTADQIKQFNKFLIGSRTDDDLKALAAVMRGGMGPGTEVSTEDLNKTLMATSIPILGISGSKDPIRKNLLNLRDRLKELKGDSKQMTFVLVDMGNHMDTFTKPEFLSGVQDFINSHASTSKDK